MSRKIKLFEVSDIKMGPAKLVLYGVEGWGKSTLAAMSDFPVIADIENGLSRVKNSKAKFTSVKSSDDMNGLVDYLLHEKHGFKTFVIDSIDWYESILEKELCISNDKDDINDFGYGFGHSRIGKMIGDLLYSLDDLTDIGMQIILIAHSEISNFTDPGEASYSRYQLSTHRRTSREIIEWCDACLFGTRDVIKNRSSSTVSKEGSRIIKTEQSNSVQAKNRYNMPKEIDGSWEAIKRYIPDVMKICIGAKDCGKDVSGVVKKSVLDSDPSGVSDGVAIASGEDVFSSDNSPVCDDGLYGKLFDFLNFHKIFDVATRYYQSRKMVKDSLKELPNNIINGILSNEVSFIKVINNFSDSN